MSVQIDPLCDEALKDLCQALNRTDIAKTDKEHDLHLAVISVIRERARARTKRAERVDSAVAEGDSL